MTTKYVVYKNDLKDRIHKKIDDPENIIFSDAEVMELYYKKDLDTIEYRIDECIKENGSILDIKNLNLKEFPDLREIARKNSKFDINKLREIYASENEIESVPDLSYIPNLRILDVGFNKLKTIENLPETLYELCCKNNEIDKISLPKYIVVLDVGFNKIKKIKNLQMIKILYVNDNQITELEDMPFVEKIVCYNNSIEKIGHTPNLKYLDATNNKIEKLNESYKYLRDLIITNNLCFQKLPEMRNIKYLEITDTGIEVIDYYPTLNELICRKIVNEHEKKQMGISSQYKIEKARVHRDDNNRDLLHIYFMSL